MKPNTMGEGLFDWKGAEPHFSSGQVQMKCVLEQIDGETPRPWFGDTVFIHTARVRHAALH